jgi:hypothetical protein
MALKDLTQSEVAWVAGIYEGEGSCWTTKGRAFHIAIVMTDFDVVRRLHLLVGVGTLKEGRHKDPTHKPYLTWSVGSRDGIDFLNTIMPWLGERRTAKAVEAIDRWHNNKSQSTKYDKECIHGHSYESPNKRLSSGSCRMCQRATKTRWRLRQKSERKSCQDSNYQPMAA